MVDYSGAVPDTFKPGVEVIVEGGMQPEAGVFKASTLMTKCPSKYEKMREEEKANKT
jgi:cytochrome c-type biogenesis protein CcmE